MQKKQIITSEYVLNSDEAKMVKTCLDYAWHRLVKHERCGISGMNIQNLDRLRKQF